MLKKLWHKIFPPSEVKLKIKAMEIFLNVSSMEQACKEREKLMKSYMDNFVGFREQNVLNIAANKKLAKKAYNREYYLRNKKKK